MSENPSLPSHIRDILASLRWRIRTYVWVEGLVLGVIWLALTFWIAMFIDFVATRIAGEGEALLDSGVSTARPG